ncbi:MAG: hypothetical protein EZS28_050732, partial [Streblomastix strix]
TITNVFNKIQLIAPFDQGGHAFGSSFVVPAQRIESWVFPSAASSAGIKTTQNIPHSHVTDMCLLFPKDA